MENASWENAAEVPTTNGDVPMPTVNGAPHTEENGMVDASHEAGEHSTAETQIDEPMEAPPLTNGSGASAMDVEPHTPVTTPGAHDLAESSFVGSVNGTSTYTTPNDPLNDMDEDKPPPAKRPRVHSDADKASMTHSASPPPQSALTSNGATPVPPPPSLFSQGQYRFCQSTIRSLKKMKDAAPFLRPVDPVVLKIPHYTTVIKNPMDFSTVDRKLASSNPTKPDPNPNNPRYSTTDEFIADVRLIVSNCLTFNGPEHAITKMAKRLEEVFDKQIKNMPPPMEPKTVAVKKPSTPTPQQTSPVPAQTKKAQPLRRASTSVPVIRRSDANEIVGRPKREIHPPPPKDLPYADVPKKQRKARRPKDSGVADQLKFCGKLLQEMYRKQNFPMAHPFYEPVDWVNLDLPTYPKLIKRPMDLLTMRHKLDRGDYPNAEKFFDDFKLMIRNCFTFNPAGTPVNQSGIELQRFFDERWKALPPLRPDPPTDDDDDEEDDDSDDERARTIAAMESQMEDLRTSITALKSAKPPKDKKKKEKQKLGASSSFKASSKPSKTSSSKKKSKQPAANDDVLTFEQKKDLSEAIGQLEGARLEKVIQMIHDAVPEIKDSNEEIELEIDLLPPPVLMKLFHFVIKTKQPAAKRNRSGKGTGTGGLKRKSMDEEVEAEKIRKLEQRMKLFEQNSNSGMPAALPTGDDSDHSSDSSSADDSSGSDSE